MFLACSVTSSTRVLGCISKLAEHRFCGTDRATDGTADKSKDRPADSSNEYVYDGEPEKLWHKKPRPFSISIAKTKKEETASTHDLFNGLGGMGMGMGMGMGSDLKSDAEDAAFSVIEDDSRVPIELSSSQPFGEIFDPSRMVVVLDWVEDRDRKDPLKKE
eukprot:CAMPEP_0119491400 /NCGR_PEP_ID=MMETSP1344-20130328/16276_1 /TAXON_ID=236787 /ORGANISM="Florenciella parvula, Strain CCMP2471" /LENGTH=160 /DNA_ID=CAMNT_0007526647 /DNA_START=1 /DNA_END=480 /DNA_ORIENTATION=+